jgi:hypothetical protein
VNAITVAEARVRECLPDLPWARREQHLRHCRRGTAVYVVEYCQALLLLQPQNRIGIAQYVEQVAGLKGLRPGLAGHTRGRATGPGSQDAHSVAPPQVRLRR